MIIEFTIGNFLSVKDKVTISLESGKSKSNPQNVIALSKKDVVSIAEDPGLSLLKSAAIYGPNASGKSNLIKAILFVWRLVKNSHSYNIDAKFDRAPFKMSAASLQQPSTFELIFIYKKIKYQYGFSCTDDKIVQEYLYYWPKGKKALIFKRTKSKEYEFKVDKERQQLIRKQMNENVLYLSRATQLGYDKMKGPYEFIVNYLVINMSPQWTGYTLTKINEEPEMKAKILDILRRTDFGGIVDIELRKIRQSVNKIEVKLNKGEPSLGPVTSGEEDVFQPKFIHEDEDGNRVELNYLDESEGTQKTLSMLGPIFDILENGKVAFIDEMEQSLHPSITQFLVRLFHSKYNKTNAQLIFTTHDVTLLDNELLRRDQIYLCTKKPNQQTELSSFLDFDLREDSSFERAYLTGRLGGLPFIDETLFD